jgi:hypothetical protein
MKYVLFTFLLASFILVLSNTSYAQYQAGKNTAGVLLGVGGGGLSGTGAIPISAEVNFLNIERNIQVGAFVSYASATEDFGYGDQWKFTYIIIAAQGNYHFMPGEKFDPYAGLSLGYDAASATYNGNHGNVYVSPSVGGLFFSAQAGFNYWFTNKIAGQLRVGYYPFVSAGITFGI